jgi:hypothetical protein
MRRAALLLVLLTALSCDRRTPVERGAEIFRPAAEKLGQAQAADLKAKVEKAYLQYLQETGSKDETELGRNFAKQHLEHYAAQLALTPEQEKAFKAGKFADVENRKKLNTLISKFVDGRGSASMVGRLIINKSQAGAEWNSGLQLELALRILEWELGSAAPH